MKLNLKTIFTIHAVIFLIYGLMDVFATETALSAFAEGVSPSPGVKLLLRMVGVTFLSMAALTWFMRDAQLSYGRRAALFALAIGLIGASILQVMGIMDGTIDDMNWLGVSISTAFGIAYIYYGNKEHTQIIERDAKEKAKA